MEEQQMSQKCRHWMTKTKIKIVLLSSLNMKQRPKQRFNYHFENNKIIGEKKKKGSGYLPWALLCNVYICVIFSCYSGYQSVCSRQMHFCNRANVRFKSTTTLHIVHLTPLCQQWSPVQYTALQPGPVPPDPLPTLIWGPVWEGGLPSSHRCKEGVGHW